MSELLRAHIQQISPLTDAEFEYVCSHFTTKKLRKHQFLIQVGDLVTHNYFVTAGCLKSYYTDRAGKDHILQFALPEWWVTDFQAYYAAAEATIAVDCLADSELLCLSLANREKLCAELHPIERFFRKKTNAGYVALQQRILSLLSSSADERYEQMLRLYPQLVQRVPKKLLAAYLGVSRETLSRLSQRGGRQVS